MSLKTQLHRLSALASLSLLAACGGTTDSQDVVDIESAYGAITTEDEAPMFGDERVAREDARDRETTDRPEVEPEQDPARPLGCRGGHIRAAVTRLDDDGVGHFFGVFTNRDGDRIGHVRGIYGHRENGRQVLFGKMIARTGRFEARIRGLWERTDRDGVAVLARFHTSRGRTANGVIRGRIRDTDARGRVLTARWAFDCDARIDRDGLPPERDDAERSRPGDLVD